MRGNSGNFDPLRLGGGKQKTKDISRRARAAIAVLDSFIDKCGPIDAGAELTLKRARSVVRRLDAKRAGKDKL